MTTCPLSRIGTQARLMTIHVISLPCRKAAPEWNPRRLNLKYEYVFVCSTSSFLSESQFTPPARPSLPRMLPDVNFRIHADRDLTLHQVKEEMTTVDLDLG
jgi:hypothetical protein